MAGAPAAAASPENGWLPVSPGSVIEPKGVNLYKNFRTWDIKGVNANFLELIETFKV